MYLRSCPQILPPNPRKSQNLCPKIKQLKTKIATKIKIKRNQRIRIATRIKRRINAKTKTRKKRMMTVVGLPWKLFSWGNRA